MFTTFSGTSEGVCARVQGSLPHPFQVQQPPDRVPTPEGSQRNAAGKGPKHWQFVAQVTGQLVLIAAYGWMIVRNLFGYIYCCFLPME